MTDFFENMRLRYSPKMTLREFSDAINDVEAELFNEHPEYLELDESSQNRHVEQAYRESVYANTYKKPVE